MTTLQQACPDELPLVGARAFDLDADFSALGIAMRDILLQRRSRREFSPEPVPHYRLSRLLWAACGCNGDDGPLRTAPSVCGSHAVDLYVDMACGLYRFDGIRMALVRCGAPVLHVPGREDAPSAPLALLYVVDLQRLADVPEQFCAADGMAACAQVPAEREALGRQLNLPPGHCVLLQQLVGMPQGGAPRNPWM
jgi:hypothetical protein